MSNGKLNRPNGGLRRKCSGYRRQRPPRVKSNGPEEMDAAGAVAGADEPAELPPEYRLPPRKWFFTFMYMNIPIVGWIYLSVKAFGKKNTQLKDFARAYLLYKLVFLVIALVILGLAVYIGLDMLDRLLAYMEML